VEAVELLRGDAPFVVDTSAWWRFSSLSGETAGLVKAAGDDDRMWIMPIVRMEILYSARSSTEYTAFETDLDALRILRNDRVVTDAAMSAIGELAERSDGYHRVPLTDALIVAAAAEHGAWPRDTRASSKR
jgi:predicted nucleic acid-binding protein